VLRIRPNGEIKVQWLHRQRQLLQSFVKAHQIAKNELLKTYQPRQSDVISRDSILGEAVDVVAGKPTDSKQYFWYRYYIVDKHNKAKVMEIHNGDLPL
jgi:hypothetical protein